MVYREFEIATFQLLNGKDSQAAHGQAVTQLFSRQLSVPLLDMERTWDEYELWMNQSGQQVESNTRSTYEKALSHLNKIAPFEANLSVATSNEEKLEIYLDYLKMEMNDSKDPARIQCLYERIVAELPLYETLWADYCKYVDRQLKTADATLNLCNRAVRNCPWSSSIWAYYIFAAERYTKEHAFIASMLSYLDPCIIILSVIVFIDNTFHDRPSRESF